MFNFIVISCGNLGMICYGYFIGFDFSVGKIVKYRCSCGYKLCGLVVSVCKNYGIWSKWFECIGKL